MRSAPKGWYPNVHDSALENYWDGKAWTGLPRLKDVPRGTAIRSAPPGWYQNGSGAAGWWTGTAWSEQHLTQQVPSVPGRNSGLLMNNRPEFAVSAAGALFAFAAILDLPSGIYTFVRLVLTGAAIALIVFSVRRGDHAWLFGLIPIALLWNPVIPVYLSRATWLPLDLAATALFVVYAVSLTRKKRKQKPGRAEQRRTTL
jgi:hypothetical protein